MNTVDKAHILLAQVLHKQGQSCTDCTDSCSDAIPESRLESSVQVADEEPVGVEIQADSLAQAIRYARHMDELSELVLLIPDGLAVRLTDIAVQVARQLEKDLVNVPAERFTGAGYAVVRT